MRILVLLLNVMQCIFVYGIGCRWGIAYEVPEDMIDLLALNNISVIRIPPGKCLSFMFLFSLKDRIVFPYRNVLSYGLGARKAYLSNLNLNGSFDTMVLTADKNGVSICTPPMEVYIKNSQTIQYVLYLENVEIVQSMCETPFSDTVRT